MAEGLRAHRPAGNALRNPPSGRLGNSDRAGITKVNAHRGHAAVAKTMSCDQAVWVVGMVDRIVDDEGLGADAAQERLGLVLRVVGVRLGLGLPVLFGLAVEFEFDLQAITPCA